METRRIQTERKAWWYSLSAGSGWFHSMPRKIFWKSAFISSPICFPLPGLQSLCWLYNELLQERLLWIRWLCCHLMLILGVLSHEAGDAAWGGNHTAGWQPGTGWKVQELSGCGTEMQGLDPALLLTQPFCLQWECLLLTVPTASCSMDVTHPGSEQGRTERPTEGTAFFFKINKQKKKPNYVIFQAAFPLSSQSQTPPIGCTFASLNYSFTPTIPPFLHLPGPGHPMSCFLVSTSTHWLGDNCEVTFRIPKDSSRHWRA